MVDRKLETRVLVLVAALACGVNSAKADGTYTIGGETYLQTVGVQIDGGTPETSALAGGIILTHDSGGGPGTFVSVCTDIEGTVYIGDTYTYAGPVAFGANYTDLPDPSWGQNSSSSATKTANAEAGLQAAANLFYQFGFYLGTSGTANVNEQTALQLAVWATLYNTTTVGGSPSTSLNVDGTSSSANGVDRFKVISADTANSSTVIGDANYMISHINWSAVYSGDLMVPDPSSQNGEVAQEMLYDVTPAPEPTTLIAGALLVLPFGASTLRFVRKNRMA